MNKVTFPALLIAVLALASCETKTKSGASSESRAQRDTLYKKLSDDEKRLPKNAVAGLEPLEGLEVQLFASEPMIASPTNMDVDAKGRVWICEARNYRPELNPDNPQRKEGDRILILEDTNGDGVADTSKVFYQGNDVNAALGVAVLGNKAIVSCSPNVLLLTDTDGDDKADKKEILFTGMEGVQHDHAVHSFSFGPDGKVYFTVGNEAKQILDRNGKPIMDKDGKAVNGKGEPYRQGMVFRVNPDGTEFEVLAHNFRNNYEAAVDSYGTIWQSDNDDDGNQGVRINYVMPYGSYGYTDELTGAGWRANRTNIEAEIPKRHWHLNDPGTIPNLLQTGAGSPTGMIVYEGRLLPKVFWDGMIHCDAGPNVVRAYPVQADGAGYKAEIVNLLEARDQWFRPSDICVAPDGSLLIADWYDPGVGGHQMGDVERGRIFRIAPPKTPYQVPVLDLSTAEGAVAALQSPNLATRYLAWEKLRQLDAQAEPALQKLWASENPRYRARALWLLAKLPGKTKGYIEQALKDKDADIRITGLRVASELESDVIPYVKQLITDQSAQVRREAAIALRHNPSPEAASLWAELALQYNGKDRWYLEALGIGADSQWEPFFAAWKAKAGDKVNTQAGHDIIWRSRAAQAMPLLAERITDPATGSAERLRYFRAFDFQKDPSKETVLLGLLDTNGPQKAEITRLALNHISATSLPKSPKLKATLDEMLTSVKGTQEFVNLVERYQLRNHNQTLFEMALAQPDSSTGIDAARLLLNLGGDKLLKTAINGPDQQVTSTVLKVLSRIGSSQSMDLIQSVMMDKSGDLAVRKNAVKALGVGWGGEARLLDVVKEGKLPKELESTAAGTLAGAMRKNVREEYPKYLKVAGTTEGKPLPMISALVKRVGVPKNGEQVFAQTCVACHQVGKQGVNFGPALTQIGSKLTKDALYVSIIHPDAGISFGYEGYLLKMKDGSELVGIIASETEDEIQLKTPGGVTTRYPKSGIVSKKQIDGSLMPSNLQQTMTEQQLVDLVEYLYSLKGETSKAVASK